MFKPCLNPNACLPGRVHGGVAERALHLRGGPRHGIRGRDRHRGKVHQRRQRRRRYQREGRQRRRGGERGYSESADDRGEGAARL